MRGLRSRHAPAFASVSGHDDRHANRGAPCSPHPNSRSASNRSGKPWRVCGGTFDVEARAREVAQLEARMAEPGFWDRPDEARGTVAKLKTAKKTVEDFQARDSTLRSLEEMLVLAESERDEAML